MTSDGYDMVERRVRRKCRRTGRPLRAGRAPPPRAAVALVRDALAAGLPALDEWRSKQLLAAYGVPVPAGALGDERGRGGRTRRPASAAAWP